VKKVRKTEEERAEKEREIDKGRDVRHKDGQKDLACCQNRSIDSR